MSLVPSDEFDADALVRQSLGGAPPGAPVAPATATNATIGWWTPDNINRAINHLQDKAGLSPMGARGLVARWAGVEAQGGPSAVNPESGAAGIGQWLGDRKVGLPSDFQGQLDHASNELNTRELAAAKKLRNAQTPEDAAIGAAMYERAAGYNKNRPLDGDNFVQPTIRTMNKIGDGFDPDSLVVQSLAFNPDDLVAQHLNADIPKGPASPTNPTGSPIATTSPTAGVNPVPESADTLQRQVVAAYDPGTPKSMVLLTKNNPANNFILAMPQAKTMTPVNTPNDIVLVNHKKLGIQPSDVPAYVQKNGFAQGTGTAVDVGNNTGGNQPVVKTEAPDGTELSARVVTDPQTAQQQATIDQANHPDGQSYLTTTGQVAQDRMTAPIADEFGNSVPVAPELLNATPAQKAIIAATKPIAPVGANKAVQQAPGGQKQPVETPAQPETPQMAGTNVDVNVTDVPDGHLGSQGSTTGTERVTFENKPDNVSNKDYFIQQLTPRLASQLNADDQDVESVLKKYNFETKGQGLEAGTPLSEIKKDRPFDFVKTQGFADDVLQAKENRIAAGKRQVEETLATGGNLEDIQSNPSRFGLTSNDLQGLVQDPVFNKEADAQKAKYDQWKDVYQNQYGMDPYIADQEARANLGYLDHDAVTKETKAFEAARDQAGFGDGTYRAEHSKAYDQWKNQVLSTFPSFAAQEKYDQESQGKYAGRALAPALHAFGLDKLFGTGEDYAKDYDAAQISARKDRLTDEQINNMTAFGEGVKKSAGNNAYLNMQIGVGTGVAEDAFALGAGLLRYAAPVMDWATGGKVSSWLDQAVEQTRVFGEASKPDDKDLLGTINSYARSGGQMIGGLPGIIGATALAGGDPIIGFGLHSLLTNSNKPVGEQLGGVYKNAMLATVFEAAPLIEEGSKVLLGPLFEKLGFSTVERSALESLTPKDRAAAITQALLTKGTRIGFIGGIGAGQSALKGGDVKQIAASGAQMALMDFGISAFGHEPTAKDWAPMDGKILRVPDAEGKPADVLITMENGQPVATDVTGHVPDGVQQAIIGPIPKPDTKLGTEYGRQVPSAMAKYVADRQMNERISDADAEAEYKAKYPETPAEPTDLERRGEDRRQTTQADFENNQRVNVDRRAKQEVLDSIRPAQVENLAADKGIDDAALQKLTGGKDLKDMSPKELLAVTDAINNGDVKAKGDTQKPKPLSNTQVEFSNEQAKPFEDFRNNVIDPKDVADKSVLPEYAKDGIHGIEPHITVKYGLHTNNHEDVMPTLTGEKPVEIELGKTSVFKGSEKKIPGTDKPVPYDVVTVKVKSPDLERLNKKLTEGSENTTTFPYDPHVTLAYVKSGEGAKYAGRTDFEGQKYTFDGVTFSPADKSGKTTIPLEAKAAEPIKSDTSAKEPTTFADHVTQSVGTDKWYVGDRPVKKLDARGETRIKKSEYARLEKEWNDTPAGQKEVAVRDLRRQYSEAKSMKEKKTIAVQISEIEHPPKTSPAEGWAKSIDSGNIVVDPKDIIDTAKELVNQHNEESSTRSTDNIGKSAAQNAGNESSKGDQTDKSQPTPSEPSREGSGNQGTRDSAEPKPELKGYGSKSKIATPAEAKELAALLRKHLGVDSTKFGAGLPDLHPDVVKALVKLSLYHIESSARSFADFSRKMAADLGEHIRPFLKELYAKVRDENKLTGMDNIKPDSEMYSGLEKTIENDMPVNASADQVKGILKNANNEERDWLGIDQYLDEHPKVSKDDLLQFVRENQAKVEEVVKGGNAADSNETNDALHSAMIDEGANLEQANAMVQAAREGIHYDDALSTLGLESKYFTDAPLEAYANVLRHDQSVNDATKFGQYTLPGGENYKELLLTMPRKGAVSSEKRYEQLMNIADRRDLTDAEQSEVEAIERSEFNGEQTTSGEDFRSGHFSEPNILAHIRFDDRTVDGKKVLHIAEIQSDWHQAGRKKGYALEPLTDLPTGYRVQIRREANTDKYATPGTRGTVYDPDGKVLYTVWASDTSPYGAMTEKRITDGALKSLNRQRKEGAPDAPFKKSWHELAVKKVLRKAVEDGYDAVSWDTGETQADRYDLSKQLNKVTASRKGDSVLLSAYDKNDNPVHTDNHTLDELPNVVGKDLAEKIAQQPDDGKDVTYSNLDLKVGGEGMKGFYDKILPNFVNKYTKKWGGKVENRSLPPATLESSGSDWKEFAQWAKENGHGDARILSQWNNDGPLVKEFRQASQSTPVHRLEITPEMKASIKEGQPLWGSQNTLISLERAQKAGEILAKRLTSPQFNAGIPLDGEILKAASDLALFHIEAGARKFADFSKRMIDDGLEALEPHFRDLYNKVFADHGFEGMEKPPITKDELKPIVGKGVFGKEPPTEPAREFTPEPKGEPSSIKHAEINADRENRGWDKLSKRIEQSNSDLHTEVQDMIAKDPEAPIKTFEKYKEHPKAVPNAAEKVLLNKHVIDMKAEYNGAARAFTDAMNSDDSLARSDAKMDFKVAETKLKEAQEVAWKGGSETGASLQVQKMFADEDFEFTKLVQDYKISKGREPSSEELQKLQDIADAHKARSEELETILAGKDQELADIQSQMPPRHILDIAENYVKKLHDLADKERERLNARGNVFQSGIDPRDLKSFALIGADHLANMTLDFAKFSDKMIDEFGDKIKPHLEKIFDEAQKILKGGHAELKSDAVRMASTLRGQKTRMENRIKELENAIAKREKINKVRNKTVPDAELTKLQAQAKSLKEDYDAIFPEGPRTINDATKLKTMEMQAEKRIAQLDQAIKTGERIQPNGKTALSSEKLTKLREQKAELQKEYDKQFPKEPRGPMTDAQRLQSLEKRLEKKQKAISEKVANNDLSETPKREPLNPQAIRSDPSSTAEDRARATRIMQARRQVGIVEKQYARMKSEAERKSESIGKWLQRKAVNYVRASMLSAVTVVEKLGASSFGRVVTRPIKQGIGTVASALPGLRGIADKAAIEGSKGLMNDLKTEAYALTKASTTGIMDMGRTWKGTGTDISNAFGKNENYIASGRYLPVEVSQLVGLMHDGLKAPAFRSEYEGVLGNLILDAKKNGQPIDNETMFVLQQQAYNYAQRAKFGESRAITDKISRELRKWENSEHTAVQAISTIARIIMPIHRISTNVIAQSFESSPLGLGKGLVKAVGANLKGLDNLTPEQADIIMRNIKNGTLGSALWAVGLFAGGKVIGSFYQKYDSDKDKNIAKYNTVQIEGYRVPAAVLHLPEFNSMFMGATMRRIYEESLAKKDTGTGEAAFKGATGGAWGLAKETPGVEAADALVNIAHAVVGGTDEEMSDSRYGVGNFVADRAVPGIVRNAAEAGDQDPSGHFVTPFTKEPLSRKINTKTFGSSIADQMQKNIPGLRNKLPLSEGGARYVRKRN